MICESTTRFVAKNEKIENEMENEEINAIKRQQFYSGSALKSLRPLYIFYYGFEYKIYTTFLITKLLITRTL